MLISPGFAETLQEMSEAVERHGRLTSKEDQIRNFIHIFEMALDHKDTFLHYQRFCQTLRNRVAYVAAHPTCHTASPPLRRHLLRLLSRIVIWYGFRNLSLADLIRHCR